MITDDTVQRAERARALLGEVREALKAYAQAGIPRSGGRADPRLFEIREQVEQQQAAVRAVNKALEALPEALVLLGAIWERLGRPEAPAPTLVTWEAGRFAGHTGTAGGVKVLTISWHTRNEDPDYLLRGELPGLYVEVKGDDLDDLKARGEQEFASWLARVQGAMR